MEPDTPKGRAVWAHLDANPGASLKDLQAAAGVNRPTAVKWRREWLNSGRAPGLGGLDDLVSPDPSQQEAAPVPEPGSEPAPDGRRRVRPRFLGLEIEFGSRRQR